MSSQYLLWLNRLIETIVEVTNILIGNFNDFDNILKQNISNVKKEVVDDPYIIAKSNSLPFYLPTFKGTRDVYQVLWDIFTGQDLTFRKFSCFICEARLCERVHLGFLSVPDVTDTVQVTTLACARNLCTNIPFFLAVTTTLDDSQFNTVFTE